MPHGSHGGVRDECRCMHKCAGQRDGLGEERRVAQDAGLDCRRERQCGNIFLEELVR